MSALMLTRLFGELSSDIRTFELFKPEFFGLISALPPFSGGKDFFVVDKPVAKVSIFFHIVIDARLQ
jgi:hypothetical protein